MAQQSHDDAGVVGGKEAKYDWPMQLSSWIKSHGGYIHPNLEIRYEPSGERGVVATRRIEEGSLLVRLSSSCALSGEGMPGTYEVSSAMSRRSVESTKATTSRKRPRDVSSNDGPPRKDEPMSDTNSSRTASPWLRCVAALLMARKNRRGENAMDFAPYFASLPLRFDTLLSWSDDEVAKFLAGTSLGTVVTDDRRQDIMRLRYNESVIPYLRYVCTTLDAAQVDAKPSASARGEAADSAEGPLAGNIDDDLADFYFACECLSSRGFHMHLDDATCAARSTQSEEVTADYNGPYMLPFMDLLNHTNDSRRKVTTLRWDPSNSAFFMKADRIIDAGEEVLHSYSGGSPDEEDGRTSEQFLRTFGFVEEGIMRCRALGTKCGSLEGPRTPAILSKSKLLAACQFVAASDYSKQLKSVVESMETDDEVWDLPSTDVMKNERHSTEIVLGEDLVVAGDSSKVLSDDIVTACVVPFLPDDAFAEWRSGPAQLDSSVLEDLFLGKLVYRTLLQAMDSKLEEYKPIAFDRSPLLECQELAQNDDELLAYLLQQHNWEDHTSESCPDKKNANGSNSIQMRTIRHAMYGLTVRLEEKESLRSLRLEILRRMDALEMQIKMSAS